MAETEELEVTLFDFSDEELIKELLDDKTPFFLLPTAMEPEPSLEPEPEPGLDRHFANFYSGPTIGDIEAALTATQQNRDSEQPHVPLSTVSLLQKGFERSKMENKYTLKIKSNGNWIGEDGYKWRKYGQKSIKNSPNPRSYYRCTNPRCSAKKQVERSNEDPDTLVVTYEGLHLHFAYSHFQLRELQPHRQFPHLLNPNNKRPKTLPGPTTPQPTVGPTAPQIPLMAGWHQQPQPQPSRLNSMETVGGSSGPPFIVEPIKSPQGFLEDMVPSLIRNPLNDPFSSYTPSLSCSSPSSLSSCSIASSSFVSWSPSSPFDVDIVSASTSTR